MNISKFLVAVTFFFGLSCTTVNINHAPKKSDFVDPQVEKYVSEFKELAEIMSIRFTRNIGVAFTKVEEPNVIGLCYYMGTYRQIELDTVFWKFADSYQRLALIYHELTHCYCSRKHDFDGKKYADTEEEKKQERENFKKTGERPGYFDDGCPRSIMHPTIVDSFCMQYHYGDYIMEMFDRCRAY
jgi:hypothetical protein